MPLIPDTPTTQLTVFGASKDVNHYHVTRHYVESPMPGAGVETVFVEWREAHDDGAGTVYLDPNPKSVSIVAFATTTENPHGDELLAILASRSADGDSVRDVTKNQSYQLLIDCGLIPAGTVE